MQYAEETMTVVSNGPHGQASLDVFSEYSNRTHRSMTATVKIQGQLHTASVLVNAAAVAMRAFCDCRVLTDVLLCLL